MKSTIYFLLCHFHSFQIATKYQELKVAKMRIRIVYCGKSKRFPHKMHFPFKQSCFSKTTALIMKGNNFISSFKLFLIRGKCQILNVRFLVTNT